MILKVSVQRWMSVFLLYTPFYHFDVFTPTFLPALMFRKLHSIGVLVLLLFLHDGVGRV
jgi:hypothetical protein